MGSAIETIEETIDYLNKKGEKVWSYKGKVVQAIFCKTFSFSFAKVCKEDSCT